MNPPYSRTRGGQSTFDVEGLSEGERKACQKRWKKLISDEPANAKAGMASSFLVLAAKKVKPGGRIGFVLPLTAAFADTWTATRKMIERDFVHVSAIAIAAGQALGKDALSADTGMEEMLLVATRRKKPNKSDQWSLVKCVTLASPVTRLGEAGEVARAVRGAVDRVAEVGTSRPIRVGEAEIGQVYVFDAGGEGAPWGPLGVINSSLAIAADRLAHGCFRFLDVNTELQPGMTKIGEMFEVGPSHDSIGHLTGKDPRGAFEFFKVTGPADAIGEDRALWKADGKTQRNLVVLPTHKGFSVDSEKVNEMRAQRGTLFYARNMRWTSQPLLAAVTEHNNMGGGKLDSIATRGFSCLQGVLSVGQLDVGNDGSLDARATNTCWTGENANQRACTNPMPQT